MAEAARQMPDAIPAWDGNARGWRRYSREVMWYVLGTKKSNRAFLAPRLIAKLTGPARLLAMSWSQIDFKGKNGVQTLLKRLAASPLVRKNLPNTSAILNQYFQYKRYPQESIANFLVRESLYYEEFVESLLALKDEQQGGTMKDVFDFSESSSSSDEDGKDDDDDDKKSRKSKASEGKTSDAKGSYKRVPTEEPSQHRGPRGGDSVPGDSPHGSRPFSRRAPPSLAGLGSFDSFILKQLRGWRLLSGACLSAEEWRAVLASTNNKLDYESVSVALTILYDDQIQFQRGGHHHQALQRGPQLFSLAEDEDWYGESSWWDDWDSWATYAGWHDDDEEWPADEPGADPEPSDDTKKENDAMAQQTWAQAHKSTQLAKKDRGFGKAAGKGSSDGCHICGHPGHYARDCPDRQAPKGKGRMYHMGYYEDDSLYAFQKGKGKSKGKYGKNMHLLDELFYMRGKGFGNNMKGKGKSKTKNTGVVNAYYADYEEPYGYHVLDFKEEVLDLQAAATETPPRAAEISLASLDNKSSAGPCGMLDSGATCSAGPESSIKNLVSALLKQDKSAKIHIDGKRCPRFRYGSGKWGKALFRISMESSLSSHTFHAYALPDPEESKEPWFNDSMLVPVLIGMDFIDSHGLIIDFSDDMAVCGNHPEGKPFYLPRNSKKHLMVDVVQFLTEGNICSQGSPTINVVMGDGIDEQLSAELFTLSIDSLCWNQYWPLILENDETGSNDQQSFECQMTSTCPTPSPWFEKLWNRRLDLNRKSGSMGSSTSKAHETSTSSTRSHGAQADQGGEGALPGLRKDCDHRSSRSKSQESSMALHGESQQGETPVQQMGSVDKLHRVRFAHGVHPQERSTSIRHSSTEPCDGAEGLEGTTATSTRRSSSRRSPGKSGDRQGGGRREDDDAVGGVSASAGDCKEEGDQGSTGNDDGGSWPAKLRSSKRISPGDADFSTEINNKLGAGDTSTVTSTTHCRRDHGAADPRGAQSADATSPTQGCTGHRSACVRSRDGARLQPEPGSELNMDYVEDSKNVHPLPLRVGQAMVNTMHYIHDEFNDVLAETVYGDKPVVWEVFCSPDSELSHQCSLNGMEAVRINLANGFDLYKDESWNQLYKLYRKKPPSKAWFSPRCTFYCDWVDLNYKHRPEVLAKYQGRERKMLRQMTDFMLFLAFKGVEIYWEWPLRCRGWREAVVQSFMQKFQALYGELWECRIDGCRFGLKSAHGNFIKKSWKVVTSSQEFYNRFRLKCCLNNHQHEWIAGVETNRSAYYPVQMC